MNREAYPLIWPSLNYKDEWQNKLNTFKKTWQIAIDDALKYYQKKLDSQFTDIQQNWKQEKNSLLLQLIMMYLQHTVRLVLDKDKF
jgi:hypothetical protein